MTERLAVLLLPVGLERFEQADHARRLLAIPRVVALEPSRFRVPKWMRDAIPARQVRRLRLPGEPRVIVLYDPTQYPLARGFCARYEQAELWYIRIADPEGGELAELDQLARGRATEVHDGAQLQEAEAALRRRLLELEIITYRAFIPGARVERR